MQITHWCQTISIMRAMKLSCLLVAVLVAMCVAQNEGEYDTVDDTYTDGGDGGDNMDDDMGGLYATVYPGQEYEKHYEHNWAAWGHWSQCDKHCGGGSKVRVRECVKEKKEGKGDEVNNCQAGGERQVMACNTHCCPVDGGWGQWSHWYSYDNRARYNSYYYPGYYKGGYSSYYAGYGYKGYGYGHGYPYGVQRQRRVRYCNSPMPSCGGMYCHGSNAEYRRTRMNYW